MIRIFFLACCLLAIQPCTATSNARNSDHVDMAYIKSGWYTPLYKEDGVANKILVKPFYLDKYQVTNREFSAFVERQPKWQPQNISPIFADHGYLSHWKKTEVDEIANKPVINVSWYAAMAYCKTLDKTLPSVDQWEYVARANDVSRNGINQPEFKQKILEWYAKPATEILPDVLNSESNVWGVHGMHGVVWEQVSDFNNVLTSGESRGDSALDKQLFCGSGAANAVDPGDYAAFMRYALRGSYEAHYTLSSLGFRCVKNI